MMPVDITSESPSTGTSDEVTHRLLIDSMANLMGNVPGNDRSTNDESTLTGGKKRDRGRRSSRFKSRCHKRVGTNISKSSQVELVWLFVVVLVSFDKLEIKGNSEKIKIVFNLQ